MKFAVALILAVATVQANWSLHRFAWKPGTETIFHYESQALSGIPGINKDHLSGLKLSSNVRVQAFSDYSVRLQMTDIKFLTINGKVRLSENGRVLGREGCTEAHVPEEFIRHLEQPFLAHLKSGVVENMMFGKKEPEPVTNIKKSLLSQLQLDISGSQRSELESNLVQLSKPSEEAPVEANEHISYFSTMEESIHGKCLTKYTIHKLPEYRINELEEAWTTEERKLHNTEYKPVSVEDIAGSGSRQAKSHCEGKKYFQITKTKDFDKCTVKPHFVTMTGAEGNCDASMARCKDLMNTMSTSTIYVCGEISDFSIRKVVSENVILQQGISSEPTEHYKFTSQVHLELLKSKPISERLQLPTNTKEENSLVYKFYSEHSGSLSEEIVKNTEIAFGVRPLLPQPELKEAHKNLMTIKIEQGEIISKVHELLRKMSNLVAESPESCSSKNDAAGSFMNIVDLMSHLSLSSLKELETKVVGAEKNAAKLFYDAVSMVGTNPSTMLVIEKVESGTGSHLPKTLLNKMVKIAIRSVKFPTQELLGELVGMLKKTSSFSHEMTASTMVQLSNLFYRAYVNPSTMVSNFPVKIYGMFGNKNSHVLVEQYIPFLTEKLEQRQPLVRLSAISALGKLGHIKALKPLLKVIEGKITQEEPMVRSLAVYSLKRIVKRNQPELKPIILSIINNPAELPDVRIAAISVLPWCQPTISELQKIAVRSWMEPSRQVSSFFASTLKSLVGTKVPELKNLGEIARPILGLLKHEEYGMQYSHNIHYSTFIDYLKTVVSGKYSVVLTKNSTVPSRMSIKKEQYVNMGAFKIRGPSFTVYTSGMDTLLEKYMHLFGKATETSSVVREQLNKIVEALEVQTRGSKSTKVFMQESMLGLESSLYLDSETVLESLEKASMRVREGRSGEFDFVGGFIVQEHTMLTASETGFPFVSKLAMPLAYSVKAHFESSWMEGSILPEVKAKIVPVLNGKLESIFGILSPFTTEVIGSGVLASIHASTPVEVKAKLTRGQLETTVKMPSHENTGNPLETIHAYVMPFTAKHYLLSVQPIAKSTDLKKIMSGNTKTFETTFGEYSGLRGQLIVDTDSTFTDLASVLEKAKQLTSRGMFSIVRIPIPTRFSSVALKINPSQSMTKEITMKIKMTTKGRPTMAPWSAGPINEQEIERLGFESIKQTLNKIGNGPAVLFEMTFGSEGRKHSDFAFVFGTKKENGGKTSLSFAGYNHKLVSSGSSGSVRGLMYESKTEYPTIKNRWNVEGLLQENIEVGYQGKITFAFGGASNMETIKMTGRMTKTENQKSAVRMTPEYKTCKRQESNGIKLSPVCTEVRLMASSMDRVELEVEAPEYLYQIPIMTFAAGLINSNYFASTTIRKMGGEVVKGPLRIKAEVSSLKGNLGWLLVETPKGFEFEVKNVYPIGKYLLPLQTHNTPAFSVASGLSMRRIPATCAVRPASVITFDGESYGYKINECSHLLLKDGSGMLPVAVTTRSLPEKQGLKSVKILSGTFVVEVIPEGGNGGSQSIVMNGKTWTLNKNEEWIERESNSGRAVAEFKRFEDDVYMVYIADQMLTVWSDGRNVEVVAPQVLRSRAIGLCGDMNGEESADVPTPKRCIMKPRLSAASYILNNVASVAPGCSGVPAEIREEFNRAAGKCIREETIKTPVLALYSRIGSLATPVVSAHVVNKQGSRVCISKSMIKVCSVNAMSHGGHKSGLNPVTLEFVCVPRPSSFAESLEKRALSGEPLLNEIMHLPVAYSKTEYEPSNCPTHPWSERSTRSHPSGF